MKNELHDAVQKALTGFAAGVMTAASIKSVWHLTDRCDRKCLWTCIR